MRGVAEHAIGWRPQHMVMSRHANCPLILLRRVVLIHDALSGATVVPPRARTTFRTTARRPAGRYRLRHRGRRSHRRCD
jgi:hypothetical protein